MDSDLDQDLALSLAAEMNTALASQPAQDTASLRAVRRFYSRRLQSAPPDFVLAVAHFLLFRFHQRWIAYELIAAHPAAFRTLGAAQLEELGQGIDSWWSVDAFARTLSGPAWLNAQVSDALIHAWARSPDLWWRRAALVSTVALNVRSHGGKGDLPRTLAVCRLLVSDHADMVAKALSWALRELVVHDPQTVRAFLAEYAPVLAARVRREVTAKLTTGLKTPRKKSRP